MGNKDLTNYIKRAMELEVAIYTHGRLITEHNKIVEGRCPAPPKKMVTKSRLDHVNRKNLKK